MDKVPVYTNCTNKNNHTTTRARHALNKKARADIITMNAAPTNVFLNAVLIEVHAAFQQRAYANQTLISSMCLSGLLNTTIQQWLKTTT